MAEESQPTKRHKPTISPNDTQSEESEPIGAHISTQLAIPIGDGCSLLSGCAAASSIYSSTVVVNKEMFP
jgi:hypothetical protein